MDKDKILHTANLAKLILTEKEAVEFKESIDIIFNDIEVIKSIEIDNEEMYSPTSNVNNFSLVDTSVSKKEYFESINNENEYYVEAVKTVE